MPLISPENPTSRRVAVTVRGVVQGVGFRPFIYRIAQAHGLAGWVQNESDVVRIEICGESSAVNSFLEALRRDAPPQARIEAIHVEELPVRSPAFRRKSDEGPPEGGTPAFEIRASSGGAAPQPTIPADLATCADCLAEVRDPAQRRYRYPFTNCTNCGPRWSIIRQLPYDRPRTSMAGFTMCPECQAEYDNPADRRFHAQPIACPRCGPALRLMDAHGKTLADGPAALDAAVAALLDGRIVALQGLGGFQLLVDATNDDAVVRLRQRKHRPDRPLALMCPSLEAVQQACEVSENEAHALTSYAAPILLLRRHPAAVSRRLFWTSHLPLPISHSSPPTPLAPSPPQFSIAAAVAPGNPYFGVMLPYTPLHHLLMDAVARPLVCTSGNLSEEPMAIATDDALRRLGPIADVLLTHDRPIVRPVDDSVARIGPDGFQVLRRARGFAPLPITLHSSASTILAVGGHLKSTVALSLSGPDCAKVVLSPHVGDLDNLLSLDVFRRAIDDLVGFFEVTPECVACDLHPDYASTRHAEELAARWNVPLVRVQHHQAHVAACMAEHGLDGPVLGLAWDGTGYGADGTIWGGEALVCQGGEFRRAAHLRTFRLPGGDRAAREPRRSALGLLFEILGDEAFAHLEDWFSAAERTTLTAMLARGVYAPWTSSMGRLFDGVAALCGLPRKITFEGQAAMALEFAADESIDEAYPLPLVSPLSLRERVRVRAGQIASGVGADAQVKQPLPPDPLRWCPALPAGEGSCLIADWEPMLRAVLADRAAGEPIGHISARFHNALAEMAVALARHAGCAQVVLTGGCFQNALLTERVRRRLLDAGSAVFLHGQVPPGDGGIALGQVFVAAKVPGTLRVP